MFIVTAAPDGHSSMVDPGTGLEWHVYYNAAVVDTTTGSLNPRANLSLILDPTARNKTKDIREAAVSMLVAWAASSEGGSVTVDSGNVYVGDLTH